MLRLLQLASNYLTLHVGIDERMLVVFQEVVLDHHSFDSKIRQIMFKVYV